MDSWSGEVVDEVMEESVERQSCILLSFAKDRSFLPSSQRASSHPTKIKCNAFKVLENVRISL